MSSLSIACLTGWMRGNKGLELILDVSDRLEMKALHETNDKENMKVKSWAWAWAWFSRRDGEECDPHHVRKQDTVMAIAKCRLM